ncbi:anion exchange protein 2, partial [Lates calcarifer]|uniref:Anion exchange protein 2 n=1 Tax=Lates calcarifer TaxID=8187 RepID=A0AAJ8DMX9_LATCA
MSVQSVVHTRVPSCRLKPGPAGASWHKAGFRRMWACVVTLSLARYAAQKLSESQREREGLKPPLIQTSFPDPLQQQLHCGAMSNPSAPNQITDAVAAVIHSVSPHDSVCPVNQRPLLPHHYMGPPRSEEEDDGDLNKALGVQRFQQILSPAAVVPDEQHHNYHEEDIEYHRHSSHHIHRPLSKLPPEGRRKKSSKKRKKDKDHKSSHVPSSGPIEEGEDEDEEEEEGTETTSAPSDSEKTKDVEFFLSDEDQVAKRGKESPHPARALDIVPQSGLGTDSENASSTDKPISSETSSPSPQTAPPEHIPLARVSSASRSYDLQERRRTGNMTGAEQAKYQRIPTDESEAQTLASADLDGIKSHRFEDVPGVRRHLVRKSTKGQVVHTGKDHKEPTTRTRKQDRTPHEVKHYALSSIEKTCIVTGGCVRSSRLEGVLLDMDSGQMARYQKVRLGDRPEA